MEVKPIADWFGCTRCGEPVRLQKHKNGNYFLEAGTSIKTYRPIRYADSDRNTPKFEPPPPMSLKDVREFKSSLREKLKKIKTEKDKVISQINHRNNRNTGIGDLPDQLKQLDEYSENLNQLNGHLDKMEAILVDERRDAIKRSDNSGMVFIWSIVLITINLVIVSSISSTGWKIAAAIGATVISAVIISSSASPPKE
jgi:hypothetical protein